MYPGVLSEKKKCLHKSLENLLRSQETYFEFLADQCKRMAKSEAAACNLHVIRETIGRIVV